MIKSISDLHRWPINVRYNPEKNHFEARLVNLPCGKTYGKTPEQAISNMKINIEMQIAAAQKQNDEAYVINKILGKEFFKSN
ncbi:MAG: hypothetical protein INQ03_15685 [Candidatus Heimdallarchaeota archaeon]|nr:hypothetical protein [Candidatus Heimdallarchaeota archaeon]